MLSTNSIRDSVERILAMPVRDRPFAEAELKLHYPLLHKACSSGEMPDDQVRQVVSLMLTQLKGVEGNEIDMEVATRAVVNGCGVSPRSA